MPHSTPFGYPEAWLAEDSLPVLHHLVEAFVLKDTSDLHRIERPLVFRKLLELAAADIGNLANLSNWAAVAQAAKSQPWIRATLKDPQGRTLELWYAALDTLYLWIDDRPGGDVEAIFQNLRRTRKKRLAHGG